MKRELLLSSVLILAFLRLAAQNCATPDSQERNQISAVRPPQTLQRYSASLTIDLQDRRRGEQQAWRLLPQTRNTPKRLPLSPARAYVRCMLAGDGDVLRFGCANGFRPVNPEQAPLSPDGFVEDTPNTTGTTLRTGAVNTITYDCVRAATAPHHKPVAAKR